MWQAASCARMSPKTRTGRRTFFSSRRKSVSFGSPASYILTGGMRSPSWKISVESEALEPATRPPMSVWWQMVAAKATRRPSWKIGLRMNTSGRCIPPSKGSFSAKTSPGRIRSP